MLDLVTPNVGNMLRRDWGLQNMIGLRSPGAVQQKNAAIQQRVRAKIANFISTAIFPQQLTVPRQYATTAEGVRIYKIMKGRVVGGVQENGVRVVVQENAQQARFVISPLMPSEHDAMAWARQNMGTTE